MCRRDDRDHNYIKEVVVTFLRATWPHEGPPDFWYYHNHISLYQIWNPQKWKKDDVPCSTKSNRILAQAGEFFILIIDGDIDYIDEDMDDEAHFQI